MLHNRLQSLLCYEHKQFRLQEFHLKYHDFLNNRLLNNLKYFQYPITDLTYFLTLYIWFYISNQVAL